MRDHGALLGEAFDVGGFLLEERDRDEQREVGVLVARLLEHAIEDALDVLPQRITPRLDHHAALDVGVLGEIRRADDLLIPFGKILLASGRDGGWWLGHGLGKKERDATRAAALGKGKSRRVRDEG